MALLTGGAQRWYRTRLASKSGTNIHAVRAVPMGSSVSRATDNLSIIKYSPRTLQVFFESAADPMMTTDREGRILELNVETEKQFGYTRQELIGEPVEKLIPLRFRETHRRERDVYQQTPNYRPTDRSRKLFALHKDGREFPLEISLNPVITESGMLFCCVIRNISEREAALEEVERHLKFERLLSELIAKFINLPANRVDQEITSGLQVLVEALDNDLIEKVIF